MSETLALSRHIKDLWEGRDALPQLIEDAEAVERVLAQPGWQAIQRVLEAEIAMIDRSLDGRPKETAAEYAHAHGRRGALGAAGEAARAILQQAATRRQAAEAAQQNEGAGESVPERAGV